MPVQVHPRWGRPSSNELYIEFYGLEESLRRRSWFGDIQGPVQAAIDRISKVRQNQINHGVTLLDLQSILICFRSATSYSLYASRSLIKGCIYMMSSMKISGKSSPFSYEFGYLCFRIMAVALGACLLNDKGVLGSAITCMIADEEESMIRTFSGHVSSITEEAIAHGGERGMEAYNCMVGWSQCQDHPRIEEVMSTADAGLLLALLWGGLELFFQVLSATVTPGLCGIMYVLWRYVIHKRQCRELSGPEAKRLKVHYTDILWRSHLGTVLDQHKAFYLLHSLNSQGLKLWEENPKYINLEDSKLIIRLIGNQMLRHTGAIAPENFSNALSYAYHHSIRFVGCEDLLPELFGGAFKQLWILIEELQDNKDMIIDIVCEVFGWLSKILICFATRCFDDSNLYNIVLNN
ncbi:unnamed protein product [Rhizoctonia solani]|uniref:Uncharacterized protein n=1 Tax=Rhizoctonia solani TaxID=456999 RepID=A0A8H3GZU5_9AGAM|nr:unnamed protein product [Rhizoctonia solani]